MSQTAHFLVAMIFAVMIIGLILRYGASTHSILQDTNAIFGTLTLQTSHAPYYRP